MNFTFYHYLETEKKGYRSPSKKSILTIRFMLFRSIMACNLKHVENTLNNLSNVGKKLKATKYIIDSINRTVRS